jgi:hypothetical protein
MTSSRAPGAAAVRCRCAGGCAASVTRCCRGGWCSDARPLVLQKHSASAHTLQDEGRHPQVARKQSETDFGCPVRATVPPLHLHLQLWVPLLHLDLLWMIPVCSLISSGLQQEARSSQKELAENARPSVVRWKNRTIKCRLRVQRPSTRSCAVLSRILSAYLYRPFLSLLQHPALRLEAPSPVVTELLLLLLYQPLLR